MLKKLGMFRYIGLAVLALIAWRHLPHLSHGCQEKKCAILSSTKQGEKAFAVKKHVGAVSKTPSIYKPYVYTLEEIKETEAGLSYPVTSQARAPPAWS